MPEDPYRDWWRPPSQAFPAPSGLPAGPADEDRGPSGYQPPGPSGYQPPGPSGYQAPGQSDYQTSPGGGYFGGADPFGSTGAGPSGPGAPETTSAFGAPPLSPEGPGMHQPPPGGVPPGANQMGHYPGDFPMEDYLRPVGPPEPGWRRNSRKALIIGLSAAAAVIVVVGAVFALTQHGPTPPVAKPSPTATPTQQLENINSVQTDPKPITGSEIFPHGRVAEDGLRFVRVAQVVNNNCALAARGAFARALKAGGCERVVRATYVDTRKRYAVTAGVAALPTSAAAQSADHKENFRKGAWFTGLNGRHGTGAQNLNSAAGYAYDLVEGRYIIYAFATDANGTPLSGTKKQERLLNSLSRSFALMVRQPINARAAQG